MTDEALRTAIKGQYHAALAMLGENIRLCPDELWTKGNDPRQFWRLAYHAIFYAHLYMEKDYESFEPYWPIEDEKPAEPIPKTKAELLEYWQKVDGMVDSKIDALDLESQESGFEWYQNFPKLQHILLSFRHIQEHVGQLADRLREEAGLDPHWVSRGQAPTQGWS